MLTFHLIYIAVAVPLTVWLAMTLYRNGDLFLADVMGAGHLHLLDK